MLIASIFQPDKKLRCTQYICSMAKAEKTSYPKEKIKILFLENISDVAVKNFQRYGYVQVEKISKALTEEQLIEEIKDVIAGSPQEQQN